MAGARSRSLHKDETHRPKVAAVNPRPQHPARQRRCCRPPAAPFAAGSRCRMVAVPEVTGTSMEGGRPGNSWQAPRATPPWATASMSPSPHAGQSCRPAPMGARKSARVSPCGGVNEPAGAPAAMDGTSARVPLEWPGIRQDAPPTCGPVPRAALRATWHPGAGSRQPDALLRPPFLLPPGSSATPDAGRSRPRSGAGSRKSLSKSVGIVDSASHAS